MIRLCRRLLESVRRSMLGRRGQIAVPSLFLIPSLFLFVYLIYETAKLSREKIRHQFALDSAAFVEMTNYADFLNRSAYVNGAFPQRIFAEGFYSGPQICRKSNDKVCDTLYNIMYDNGAFPRSDQVDPLHGKLDDFTSWQIRFNPAFNDQNLNPPRFAPKLELITMQNALDYYISFDDVKDIYKLYVQIYTLLGSVEDAQYQVFKRLTQGQNPHTFFRKSYWLNTGDDITNAADGAQYFSNHAFEPKAECIQYINIVGNEPTPDPYQPYKQVQPKNPMEMQDTIQLCSPRGLFQVAYVRQSQIDEMNRVQGDAKDPGYPVVQHWLAPRNYFNVRFNELFLDGKPKVHATISLSGGAVWPDPTPKFQTRLYP